MLRPAAAVVAALALLGAAAPAAWADEVYITEPVGRVLSSVPIVQEMALPNRVCSPETYVTRQPSSGAGAVVGAIAGGLLGNTVGHGRGRSAATVVGAVGGALLGNEVEGSRTVVEQGQRCYQDTRYEQRVVGYKVIYSYGGRQYQTRLDHDPGPTVALHVSPAGGVFMPDGAYAPGTTTVITTRPSRPETVYVEAPPPPTTVYVAPVYRGWGGPPPPPPHWGWGPGPRYHDRWGW